MTLSTKITIRNFTEVADGMGGFTTTHTDTATWAKVSPLKGREAFDVMKLEEKISHRITLRHGHTVTAKSEIRIGSRVLKVKSVIDIEEAGLWLEVLAEEIT